MSNSPKDHDFDWVKARHECSIKFEFECLRQDIERCRDTRADQVGCDGPTKIIVHSKSDMICVERRNGADRIPPAVTFRLADNHIRVEPPDPERQFNLTLTLGDDGACRYRIDGDGEYWRWQVLRRALEPLLFESPR